MSGDAERYFSKRSDVKIKPDATVAIAVPEATGTPALRSQLLPTAVPHYYMVSSLEEALFLLRNDSCPLRVDAEYGCPICGARFLAATGPDLSLNRAQDKEDPRNWLSHVGRRPQQNHRGRFND